MSRWRDSGLHTYVRWESVCSAERWAGDENTIEFEARLDA